MELIKPNLSPSFNITRASHLVVGCADLERSKVFYTEVVGLVVSDEQPDALYLRGIEETAHHSLELRRVTGQPFCDRIGMRVFTEEDVLKAHHHFKSHGLPAALVTKPYQGTTLHAADASGLQFEFCATMDRKPRLIADNKNRRGAGAFRLDHFQVLVPEVEKAYPFYADLGFRVSDLVETGEGVAVIAFMHRKSSPYDLVLVRRTGPRFHHCGYIIETLNDIFKACDIAGQLGWCEAIERGPGRHPLGHSLFVYLRDPDGHRVELLPAAHQLIDIDEETGRWLAGKNGFLNMDWGPPPPDRWMNEAMPFGDAGTAVNATRSTHEKPG